MVKEKFEYVESWEELQEVLEKVNPYKKTIILSGYVRETDTEHRNIITMIFKVVPIEILKDDILKDNKEKD